MPERSCQEQFYSDDYYDFIAESVNILEYNDITFDYSCLQRINEQYDVIVVPRSVNPPLSLTNYPYTAIPKCYGLSDTQALEASGIYAIQRYPGFELTGRDVLIGFIDTGIDYRLDAFRTALGQSRISAIWDQTIPSDTPPFDLKFGTEYTREQIDAALASDDPLSVVPSMDENGHGTAVASVAAGSFLPAADFSGAAPDCDIAVVKLKEAKPYLKDFYCIFTDAPCYQENDIMAGISYLNALANRLRKPLVICLGIETNMGDHDAGSPLGSLMNQIAGARLRSLVIGTGNEANNGHHYKGQILTEESHDDVEIRVDSMTRGFTAELWGSTPDLFSIAILSPTGEELPRIPVSRGQMVTHRFLFEQTTVYIEYLFSSIISGAELIQIRFRDLAPGIWTIRVYINNRITGQYNMWLPIKAFMDGNTYFLNSTPDTTLSNLASVDRAISTGSYDSTNGSISIHSGRGYTRLGRIKPELCSPGVNVYAAASGGRFTPRSGGSIAAAICAGAAALIIEWAATLGNEPFIDAATVKSILIRGTKTDDFRIYPNRECGYGTLDLFHSFEILRVY